MTQKTETKKLSFLTKLVYGSGNASANLLVSTAAAFLTFYYTDVAGISTWAAGVILLVCRILDGVSDLIMGVVVDKTRSKYGKARPWLLRMAIPYFAALVLMFWSPSLGATGKVIYAAATYILGVAVVYTIISVPYNTLSALITNDPNERTALSTFRQFFGNVAPLAINIFTMPIINALGGGQHAWTILSIIYGVIGAALYLAVFFNTKELNVEDVQSKKSAKKEKGSTWAGIKGLFTNKYWIIVLIVSLLLFIMNSVQSAAAVYYSKYIFDNSNLVATFAIAGMIPIIIACFFIPALGKKFGKRNLSMAGLVLAIIGCIVTVFGSENLTVLLAGTVIRGFGIAPLNISVFAMLGDTVEYGEWKNGNRNEGLTFCASTFAEKVGQALGGALTTFALAIGGYVANAEIQTSGAIMGMKFSLIGVPAIVVILSFIVLIFYKLDGIYPQILADLEERKKSK